MCIKKCYLSKEINLCRKVKIMKKDIHPNYQVSKVSCACGNHFETKSVKPEIRLEVCSACHPFFTGTQKFVTRGGRVEKFKQKFKMD